MDNIFDFLTWWEIITGEFIERSEISPDIMKSLDDDIDSVMNELNGGKTK